MRAMQRHQLREQETPNADKSRPPIVLIPPQHGNFERTARALIGNQKIRKNAVLANEIICTASPEFFRPSEPRLFGRYDDETVFEWCSATLDYLTRSYGLKIVSVVLHLDETTPHIHAVIVPLDERGRLNAREVIGGPAGCRRMQDQYAAAVSHLGLRRGERGSTATHQKIRRWYEIQDELDRLRILEKKKAIRRIQEKSIF